MAKINITGVAQGEGHYIVDIVLTKKEKVEGELQDVAVASNRVTIFDDAKPSQVKAKIVEAAHEAIEKVREAKRKRATLEKVEYPEIEE